jgi:hypothetical protein
LRILIPHEFLNSNLMRRRDFITLGGAAAVHLLSARVGHAAAPRWIDVHMHVVGGAGGEFARAVDQAAKQMDAAGIAKAIVFPPPEPHLMFDYLGYAAELGRYPGRFGFLGGGGFLNSMIQESSPEAVTPEVRERFVAIAEQIADAGAAGYGEIAILHLSLTRNHPFEQVAPEHPLLLALVETAGRRGLVIDLHMDPVVSTGRGPSGLHVPPNPASLMANVAGLERLLDHDRNARIVWAHGGSDFTNNMTPALIGRLMDAHANLSMSLRPVPAGVTMAGNVGLRLYNTMMPGSGIDKAWLALLERHPDRFVLGSDSFMLSPTVPPNSPLIALSRGNQMRLAGAKALIARLPKELAANVAELNATRLYRV